ncbi:hypothetical protein SLEP1_g776 [Rubroshorea leprosula]|uniref:Uncharacterized protein n=1 Tax=Rubroshorea leprosula TaxID=152421 RepID=A0AAV5HBQ8_9ROSI|nr:hypothetical protein SLEP1_g776 [Rubroshorea leprosula]
MQERRKILQDTQLNHRNRSIFTSTSSPFNQPAKIDTFSGDLVAIFGQPEALDWRPAAWRTEG